MAAQFYVGIPSRRQVTQDRGDLIYLRTILKENADLSVVRDIFSALPYGTQLLNVRAPERIASFLVPNVFGWQEGLQRIKGISRCWEEVWNPEVWNASENASMKRDLEVAVEEAIASL